MIAIRVNDKTETSLFAFFVDDEHAGPIKMTFSGGFADG